MVVQWESCPRTSRIHQQGYVRFNQPKSLRQLKGVDPKIHWEPSKGSEESNIKYCTKDDTRVAGPFQFGTPAQPGKRKDIDIVRQLVKEKKTLLQIADEVSSYQALRFAQTYLAIQPVQKREQPVVYWLWGSTATGKTRWAWERAEEIRATTWCSHDTLQWFDGYTGQQYVIIDDFRGSSCKFSFFLKILDRYPLKVPVKGGYVTWEPQVIVITSPFEPDNVYRKEKEDLRQLLRRINFIKHFTIKQN